LCCRERKVNREEEEEEGEEAEVVGEAVEVEVKEVIVRGTRPLCPLTTPAFQLALFKVRLDRLVRRARR
jgi:hypothetical protein